MLPALTHISQVVLGKSLNCSLWKGGYRYIFSCILCPSPAFLLRRGLSTVYVQNTPCWGLILQGPTSEPVTSKRVRLASCKAPLRWKTCVEPGRFSLAASSVSRLSLGCPHLFCAEDKPRSGAEGCRGDNCSVSPTSGCSSWDPEKDTCLQSCL